MKKLSVVILIIFVSIFSFSSCSKEIDLSCYVSQLRQDIYIGENDEYKLTVYQEKRENPFVADTFIGNLENHLIVKIESKTQSVDGVSASFCIDDKEYKGNFVFNPITNKFALDIVVEKFCSQKEIEINLYKDTETQTIQVKSMLFEKTKSYDEVLKSVSKHDKNLINRLFKGNKVIAEIHIRLLYDDDKNYYYVGFVESDKKTTCYLVDGQTLQVLATKNVE